MTTAMPSREQIERAQPLEFSRPAERQANITISGELNGLTVEVEFAAAISSIPAAIERLRAIGMSAAQRNMTPAPISTSSRRPKVERVDPGYLADGTPICPAHRKPLQESQYGGWYCASKAKPGEAQNDRGYCSLKFAE